MFNRLIPLFLFLMLGCLSIPATQPELCGPAPTQYQAEIAAQSYTQQVGLKDPTSAQIRNVQVGGTIQWYRGLVNGGGYDHGWEVSFDMNARNSFGGYVGFRRITILYVNGTILYRMLID
jgi:hypothetical protein